MIFINNRPLTGRHSYFSHNSHRNSYFLSPGSRQNNFNFPGGHDYDTMLQYRSQIYHQRRSYLEKKLKENLPLKYLIFHVLIVAIISIALIGFQIVAIIKKAPSYYAGMIFLLSLFFFFSFLQIRRLDK
jgi:hypothetical protein